MMELGTIVCVVLVAIFIYTIVDRICNAAEYIADTKTMAAKDKKIGKLFNGRTEPVALKVDKNGKATPCDLDGNPIENQKVPDIPPEVLGAVADHFRMMKARREDDIEKEQLQQEESNE